MIGALGELSTYVLGFCLNLRFRGVVVMVYIVVVVYMQTITHEVFGCLLGKVKGMNDRGIRRTFPLCARVLPKFEI